MRNLGDTKLNLFSSYVFFISSEDQIFYGGSGGRGIREVKWPQGKCDVEIVHTMMKKARVEERMQGVTEVQVLQETHPGLSWKK